MNESLYLRLADWLDTVIGAQLPQGIAAFHCNLYDGPAEHELELIGASTYDSKDSDWACDDIFMSPKPRFVLAHRDVGERWEDGLSAAVEMLTQYVQSERPGAIQIRESQAFSVGFVDGDLHLIWAKA